MASSMMHALVKKSNLDKKILLKMLSDIDGEYSLAIETEKTIILATDIIGIRPMFYDGLNYSTDKRKLKNPRQLDPKYLLTIDKDTKKTTKTKRGYFDHRPVLKKDLQTIKTELKDLLFESILKRLPKGKIGILFSGGIDSTFLAFALKKLKQTGRTRTDFICYTAAFSDKAIKTSEDLIYSKKIAKDYCFKLRTKTINLDKTERWLKRVVSVLDDTNVVKVGVGITGSVALKPARLDGVKVVFTGLGSEELFAGYERHRQSPDINRECLAGLKQIYERDCYRDYILCKEAGFELRLPFLDRDVIDYSLKIPARFKLKEQNKIILREIAKDIGIDNEYAQRKKRGAQYGSKFDRAIKKLSIINGFKYKSDYLKSLKNER